MDATKSRCTCAHLSFGNAENGSVFAPVFISTGCFVWYLMASSIVIISPSLLPTVTTSDVGYNNYSRVSKIKNNDDVFLLLLLRHAPAYIYILHIVHVCILNLNSQIQ